MSSNSTTTRRIFSLQQHLAASEAASKEIDYEAVKAKYAQFRDDRLVDAATRRVYTSEIDDVRGGIYTTDPWADSDPPTRAPITDKVDVLIIGGGFSALLTSARLRELGSIKTIRVVEKGADFGGTWWVCLHLACSYIECTQIRLCKLQTALLCFPILCRYWNRYPGVACDVPSYDYLPLLDELDYVPTRRYAGGNEIFNHCRAIAKKYDLVDLATFRTTVTTTVWSEEEQLWNVGTDRGDQMKARFVVVANGTLSKPKLPQKLVDGLEQYKGETFHTSRWNYDITGADLEKLKGKRVGILGTGATAVQAIPELAKSCGELLVFQRTPSSVQPRGDFATDPNWARRQSDGWQNKRRERMINLLGKRSGFLTLGKEERRKLDAMTPEQRARRAEEANIRQVLCVSFACIYMHAYFLLIGPTSGRWAGYTTRWTRPSRTLPPRSR